MGVRGRAWKDKARLRDWWSRSLGPRFAAEASRVRLYSFVRSSSLFSSSLHHQIMLKVEQAPSPGHERKHSLADLSRNASVISTGSSDSAPEPLLLTPPRRPRPIRTFSSPRSQSPSGPTTPRTSRPPAYMTRELGIMPDEPPAQAQLPVPQHENRTNHERRQRASSKSKSRPGSVARPSRDDFEFGDILGEGSYSTVRCIPTVRVPLGSDPRFRSGNPCNT